MISVSLGCFITQSEESSVKKRVLRGCVKSGNGRRDGQQCGMSNQWRGVSGQNQKTGDGTDSRLAADFLIWPDNEPGITSGSMLPGR